MHSFDLHLRSVNNGVHHPAAKTPVVRVCESFPVVLRPRTFVRVAGEYVVVMLVNQDLPTLDSNDCDILYFVHWRSGVVHKVEYICSSAVRMPTDCW